MSRQGSRPIGDTQASPSGKPPRLDYRAWPTYRGLKTAAISAFDSVGLSRLLRSVHRRDLLVLAYHDVLPGPLDMANPLFGMAVETSTFRAHIRELHECYVPVSLSDVLRWLHDGAALPDHAALVTFDDGHRSIVLNALPVLEEFGVPAVVFMTAGFLGERHRLTWYEELFAAVMSSPVPTIRLEGTEVSLGSPEAKARFCGKLIDRARELNAHQLDVLLGEVMAQLGTNAGTSVAKERFAWLTPEDCASLVARGVDIGAHSLSHPFLRALDSHAAMREIEGSKSVLESHLGCRVEALAYPFGEPGIDFGVRDVAMARAAGFRAAFAASGGLVKRRADPWCLSRVGMGEVTMPFFRFSASGARSLLRDW